MNLTGLHSPRLTRDYAHRSPGGPPARRRSARLRHLLTAAPFVLPSLAGVVLFLLV